MPYVTPREVGYLPSRLTVRKKMVLELTKRQQDILIGSILGDGYIYRQGKIQIEHSVEQKEYLFWKYQELQSLAYSSPPALVHRADKRTGRTYRAYRFWLRQYFRPWRALFYAEDATKRIPAFLQLSPMSLVVWYMDDGCWSDERCTLSTESFSEESMQRIQNQLKEQYDIATHVRSNGKLLIRAESRERFFSIIKAHVHKSLQYKIS